MNEEARTLLEPMARVIAQQLAHRPEHFITHPAELKLFHSISDEALRHFAHELPIHIGAAVDSSAATGGGRVHCA